MMKDIHSEGQSGKFKQPSRHMIAGLSPDILLCWGYNVLTMHSYSKQHNQAVRILNFLYICTSRKT